MDTIIQTEGLSKEYGGTYRVRDLDLKILPQEVYGFLGPNGAGKSTTMKMLLGLAHPTSGKVRVLGMPFDAQHRIAILKQVGSLIEAPSYYGHLTGMENMQVLARLLDLPQKNIDKAVQIVRMEQQMSKQVKHYSLGMKQRLGIAMALARFPKVLILDEPTNGLDPAGIEEIRDLIRELPKQYGMTVMISSHLLSEIDQMVTAVGIINKGELIFQDKMKVLNEQRQPKLFLRTSNNAVAAQIIRRLAPAPVDSGLVLPRVDNGTVGQMVQALCQHNILVYRVEEHQRTLEDVFLELTGTAVTL